MVLAAAAAMVAVMTMGSGTASAQSGYCDRVARDYANRATSPAGNVLGGAVAGAGVGAIIGGIAGGGKGAGKGAAIGAGVGALGGAANQSGQWNNAYRAAFNDCMARNTGGGGGYGRPEPWTAAWYDYCGSKYRSFNPQTGYYRTYSGKNKFCR